MKNVVGWLAASFIIGLFQLSFAALWLAHQWSPLLLVGTQIGGGLGVLLCACVAGALAWRNIHNRSNVEMTPRGADKR